MKSLKNYIAESTKMHVYYIKVATPLSDAQVNTVESLLRAYQLVDFGKLTKIEDDRFDFFDIYSKDAYSIRVVTNMPLSSYVVQQQLRDALNIPEKFIVVRGSNEPIELEAEDERFKQKAADEVKAKGFTFASRLDTDRLYDDAEQPEVTDIFGNNYNKNLLGHLANVKADRKSMEFEPSASLFSWIEMKKVKPQEPVQDAADFNAGHDTPKPVTGKGNKNPPVKDNALGTEGNFDDGATKNISFYADKQGKRKVTQAPRANKG